MTTTFAKPGIRSLLTQANKSIHPVHLVLLLASGRELMGQLLEYDDTIGLVTFAELESQGGWAQPNTRHLPDLYIDVNHVVGVRLLKSPEANFVEEPPS